MSANTINRHRFIIDRIRRSPCTRDELVRAVDGSHSVHTSVRTVQRDIEHVRHEYGVIIVYSRTTKNYHIDDSDTNASKVMHFLGEASLLDLVLQTHGAKIDWPHVAITAPGRTRQTLEWDAALGLMSSQGKRGCHIHRYICQ